MSRRNRQYVQPSAVSKADPDQESVSMNEPIQQDNIQSEINEAQEAIDQSVQAIGEKAQTASHEAEAALATPTPVTEEKAPVEPVVAPKEPVSNPTPVAQTTQTKETVRQEPKSQWDSKIEKLQEDGSLTEKYVLAVLQDYVSTMTPGKPNETVVINQKQIGLWRMIQKVVGSEADFSAAFTLVIDYFRQYQDGVFGDRYLFRGMETVPLDKTQITYFQAMLNVLSIAAGSKTHREVQQQVDLNRVMSEEVYSDDARSRVFRYFGKS